MLLVLGIFVQFYMRAGVFTDGGKRERERVARKQQNGRATPAGPQSPNGDEERL
jgi:hypothetical protein